MSKFRLEKENTVLMIIDLQEKLMAAMPDREKVYHNTRLLLAMAANYEMPVVLTEQYPRGLGSTVPEVSEALGKHHRLEKVRFSAFIPEMDDLLRSLGRKTVLMTGSETHVCVFQTTRDLLEKDYNVHLVKDAVCSRFTDNYSNGLALMHDMGAVITNTETVLFDLLIDATSPHFRSVSAMLK